MKEDMNPEERRPVWAESFIKRFHFRVEFGYICADGLRRLPDGTSPVATVQVNSWSIDSARRRALYIARSLYRDRKDVLKAEFVIRGYQMDGEAVR